jgi:thioredoxin 1
MTSLVLTQVNLKERGQKFATFKFGEFDYGVWNTFCYLARQIFKIVTTMNNFQQLIAGDKPVLVDFFATWCGPCKMMHPILEDVKAKVGDRATLIKIDVEQAEDLAMQYRIQAVPTLMIFKNGEVVWRGAGVQDAATLTATLSQFT